MDIRKLQRVIVDGLEDVKAQDIVVFNTEHLSPLFERVIIASGTSNRQTRSLATSVRDAVKGAGLPPPRLEGEANGEWIIVDCGAAVVHVMQPSIRDYYHLEELWGEKPVKMKLGAGAPRLTRTAGPDVAPRSRAPAARPAEAARPATRKRAAGRTAAPAAGAGSRTPAPKKAVTRSVGVKRPLPKAAAATRKPGAAKKPATARKPDAGRKAGAAKKAGPRKASTRR